MRICRRGLFKTLFYASALTSCALPLQAQDAFQDGMRAIHDRNWNGAITDFTQAIARDPKSGEAYCHRGYAKGEKHDADGAIADYSQAIALDPKLDLAFWGRGSIKYHEKFDTEGGLADLEQALALNPHEIEAHWSRGNLRFFKKDLDGAIADFDSAIHENEGAASAYEWRGYVEYEKTLAPEADADAERKALADLRKSIELNPHDSDGAHFFIWLIEAKKPSDAEMATKKLADFVKFSPDKRDNWMHQIGLFLIGESSESDLLKAAELNDRPPAPERQAEAFFYIGMKHVYAGDNAGALSFFQQSLKPGWRHGAETDLAQAQLDLATGLPGQKL